MFQYHIASLSDAPHVISLLAENGNPHEWSLEKWRHYYVDYPLGRAYSIVARENGQVVGHYGMAPVSIGDHQAMLGMHAYVATTHRGMLAVMIVRGLMELAERSARDAGADFLVGFSNPRFSKILSTLYGWRVLGFLEFSNVDRLDVSAFKDCIRFKPDDPWYRWKFGDLRDYYAQEYQKDDRSYFQLLKTRTAATIVPTEAGHPLLNCWLPANYSAQEPGAWSQPFCIRWLGNENPFYNDIHNWYIEMGDSDTFGMNRS